MKKIKNKQAPKVINPATHSQSASNNNKKKLFQNLLTKTKQNKTKNLLFKLYI